MNLDGGVICHTGTICRKDEKENHGFRAIGATASMKVNKQTPEIIRRTGAGRSLERGHECGCAGRQEGMRLRLPFYSGRLLRHLHASGGKYPQGALAPEELIGKCPGTEGRPVRPAVCGHGRKGKQRIPAGWKRGRDQQRGNLQKAADYRVKGSVSNERYHGGYNGNLLRRFLADVPA